MTESNENKKIESNVPISPEKLSEEFNPKTATQQEFYNHLFSTFRNLQQISREASSLWCKYYSHVNCNPEYFTEMYCIPNNRFGADTYDYSGLVRFLNFSADALTAAQSFHDLFGFYALRCVNSLLDHDIESAPKFDYYDPRLATNFDVLKFYNLETLESLVMK